MVQDNIEELRIDLIKGLEEDLQKEIERENYEKCAEIKEKLDILKGVNESSKHSITKN